VAISPLSRLLAVAEPGDQSTSVTVIRLDGSARRAVWSTPAGVSVETLSWSPDGSKLLFMTSSRTFQGMRPVTNLLEAVVIDTSGRVLLERPDSNYDATWLGSGRVMFGFLRQNSNQPTPSEVVDLASGKSAPGPRLDGLFCTSPDGRLGVYGELSSSGAPRTPAKHRVVNLQTGEVLLEAQTRPEIGSCAWTPDSSKVVLSPGGK
jgi:dipeptidyl aminopeptidase/acylaminoacyl peptidase